MWNNPTASALICPRLTLLSRALATEPSCSSQAGGCLCLRQRQSSLFLARASLVCTEFRLTLTVASASGVDRFGVLGAPRFMEEAAEDCGAWPPAPASSEWGSAVGLSPRTGGNGQLIGDRAASQRPRLFGEKQGKMELSPSAGGQGWASLWPSQPLPQQAPSSVRSACVCLFLNAIPCQAALH